MTDCFGPLPDKRMADHSAFQVWLPPRLSMGFPGVGKAGADGDIGRGLQCAP